MNDRNDSRFRTDSVYSTNRFRFSILRPPLGAEENGIGIENSCLPIPAPALANDERAAFFEATRLASRQSSSRMPFSLGPSPQGPSLPRASLSSGDAPPSRSRPL
jgi:hypothetical protein